MLTSDLLDRLFDTDGQRPEYETIEEMIVAAAEMIRPPERLTVSQAAAKYRHLHNPGSYIGLWPNEKTPYLVEPMDTLQSLDYTGLVFAGPARTGKSDMLFNWLTYTSICDPADMIVYHMTEKVAREWSKGDLAKMLRHSPKVRETLLQGRQNDNVHDKYFKSGMKLLISWPSLTELSGKTIPRIWLQDYDRMDDDIEKEGSPFDLAKKRTQTFKRFGMTCAESSPGREVEDPKWLQKAPHEAPPTKGILALYNRGDRRRWQWPCPFCEKAFEPSFDLFTFPEVRSRDIMEVAEQVTMECPHCRIDIEPRFKDTLNRAGKWVKEGLVWLPKTDTIDYHPNPAIRPIRSEIASFWLKGPAASFQDWWSLVFNYLQAEAAYDATGDEAPLKKTVNTDQGEAYISKAMLGSRRPEELRNRAEKLNTWHTTKENPTVPLGVGFLVATIDVQEKSFVVQVHGLSNGNDVWLVDMFKIRKSERKDEDGDTLPINPGGYFEDWKLLVEKVIERTYELDDNSGRRMMIKAVGCDWGGAAGVSSNALKFWRWLGSEHKGGYQKRFHLVKGEVSKTLPRTMLKYPDAGQKDSYTAARGDVPVIFMNSNRVKDQAAAMLERSDMPGGGMLHTPNWTEGYIYSQLTTEVRIAEKWENPNRKRNEAWDLLYYCLGLIHERSVGIMSDRPFFWDKPPRWAGPWNENDLVYDPNKVERPFGEKKKNMTLTLAELGKQLT